jgi:hypothetical protein
MSIENNKREETKRLSNNVIVSVKLVWDEEITQMNNDDGPRYICDRNDLQVHSYVHTTNNSIVH